VRLSQNLGNFKNYIEFATMEQVFFISVIATLLFFVIKFAEMKFVQHDMKPLKYFVRDTVMVFVSTLTATFAFFYAGGSISDFMNVMTETKVLNPATTQVFTDTPGF